MVKCGTRRRAGFTLIELLVAISVLAVVAVLGWRGLDGIVRARIALNEQLAQTRGMQLAFAQMQSDGAQIVPPALIGNRVTLQAEQERLLLVRTVYAEDQPPRLQVVAYRLQGGVLRRQESVSTRNLAELDSMWQAAQSGNTAAGIALESEVAAMAVRIWSSDRPGWRLPADLAASNAGAHASADVTPGAGAPALVSAPAPIGLEVSLQLRGDQASMVKVFLLGAT